MFIIVVFKSPLGGGTNLKLCVMSPVGLMRRKAFFVVAKWKLAFFALAKNVSGHHIRSD